MSAPDGGVVVVTFLRGRQPFAPLFAVQMLVVGGGGDTYSVEEYRRWLAGAGLGPPDVTDPSQQPSLLAAGRTPT